MSVIYNNLDDCINQTKELRPTVESLSRWIEEQEREIALSQKILDEADGKRDHVIDGKQYRLTDNEVLLMLTSPLPNAKKTPQRYAGIVGGKSYCLTASEWKDFDKVREVARQRYQNRMFQY